MRSSMSLAKELTNWINNSPEREALLIEEAPIGESTLRATKRGRYIPGPLLDRAIRAVMLKYPSSKGEQRKAAAS